MSVFDVFLSLIRNFEIFSKLLSLKKAQKFLAFYSLIRNFYLW